MVDCLELIFHSFWTWLGTTILAFILVLGLEALRGGPFITIHKYYESEEDEKNG